MNYLNSHKTLTTYVRALRKKDLKTLNKLKQQSYPYDFKDWPKGSFKIISRIDVNNVMIDYVCTFSEKRYLIRLVKENNHWGVNPASLRMIK